MHGNRLKFLYFVVNYPMMTTLKPGDKAPDFTWTGEDGLARSLKEFSGKKIILYFYPKDNTPGCTLEACSLRDHHDELLEAGFVVIGVSADTATSHSRFSARFNLPFFLVPDTAKEVLKLYGVWGPKKFLGKTFDGIHRTTFVIDAQGIILKVITKVDTKNHAKQIMKEMNQ